MHEVCTRVDLDLAEPKAGFLQRSGEPLHKFLIFFAVEEEDFHFLALSGNSWLDCSLNLVPCQSLLAAQCIVAQVDFLEWTESDHLRHSNFSGIRSDKGARSVVKEHAGEA